MPDFYPFFAQIPNSEGMPKKDPRTGENLNPTSTYLDLIDKVQAPLGHVNSSDPSQREEIQQSAKTALDEIINRCLLSSIPKEPVYVLYQSTYRGITQTGIVGLCNPDQIGSLILPHEQIRQDRASLVADWMKTMNLQWTPVFLSYRHDQRLHALKSSVTKKPSDYQFTLPLQTRLSLWCISDKVQLDTFRDIIAKIPRLYIADGHHRAAACQGLSLDSAHNFLEDNPRIPLDNRDINDQTAADPKVQTRQPLMLAVLMADRDLKIYPFYRRIRNDHGPVPFWEILDKLQLIFRLKPCSLDQMFYQYLPSKHFLLVHKEACWLLQPLKKDENVQIPDNITQPEFNTDVQWLQENVLGPICGIKDPTTDPRIDFGSMNLTLEKFRAIMQEATTEFILIPRAPSTEDVFQTADMGKFLPPKSTSFEPKIPSGFVIYRHQDLHAKDF